MRAKGFPVWVALGHMRVIGLLGRRSSLSLLIDIGGEEEGGEGNRGQGQDRAEDKLLRREERKERDTGGQSEAYI